jgi:cation diffusion facilitator family transporter
MRCRGAPTRPRAPAESLLSVVPSDTARDPSAGSVLTALAANTTIAIAKGTAAALTASPALFAETLHTIADAGNEILLWIALRRSRREPDETHPFGYGPERYYWALLAAVGMFVIGGAVSVWEGINALISPEPLEAFWAGVIVLVIALVLDSVSRFVAQRQLRRDAERRGISVRQLLRESPDPTVVTVYLEDSIDVLGAGLALIALILHRVTDSAVPDALVTIVIGLMLIYVASKLTSRNRQLLSNQAIPERYKQQLRERLLNADGVESVASLEAIYLGPGEVLVAADVRMTPGLSGEELTAALVRIREYAAREVPVIARLYLTPV